MIRYYFLNSLLLLIKSKRNYITLTSFNFVQCEGFPSSGDKKGKLFSYNVVFEPTASQEDILQFSGVKKLIEMAVEGFSCTAFCYGQTGSGKTHTLTGPPEMVRNGKTSFFNFLNSDRNASIYSFIQ